MSIRSRILVLPVMLLCLPTLSARAQTVPINADFEQVGDAGAPSGWIVPGGAVEIVDEGAAHGERCAVLTGSDFGQQGRWGNLMQSFDATPFQGKRVRFIAAARVEGDFGRKGQLWMRVDRPDQAMGFFENMDDRPIIEETWAEYSITGEIDDDAVAISIGFIVTGTTRGYLDHVRLEVLGAAGQGNQPPRPLTARGLINLRAYARLFGYVRHFHPSDEAAQVDWEAFAIEGVRRVEEAQDSGQLSGALRGLFGPIAPGVTIDVLPVRVSDPAPESPEALGDLEAKNITAWWHFGFGQHDSPDARRSLYLSRRQYEPFARAAQPEEIPPLGTAVVEELGGGVWCRVPVTLVVNDHGTQPKADRAAPEFEKDLPDGWAPTGNDRATRLGGVVLAWNILQHFYPYFDVVDTDWNAALDAALESAATDADQRAFLDTLRRLVAKLHDGHGGVYRLGSMPAYAVPVAWDWIEDRLVVTRSDRERPKAGDVVERINGREVAELVAEAERLISGATPGWIRKRALGDLAGRDEPGRDTLDLLSPDGTRYSSILERIPAGERPVESLPDKIQEIRPGLWYLDLDRITDGDFNEALEQLEGAAGIVFDLRGYPRGISTVVISHLIDEPITCAQWHIPIVTLPDHRDMKFRFSNWPVQPIEPRLKAPVAFIIGGGAISYAETYLGIVENYMLAELVGARTAGTNGNVNPITLPGGYTVTWTGMKVLKHDGSPHHGVGISPTVPVARTIAGAAAGIDECLEKAIETVLESD